MMKIGIIGCDSSHSLSFTKVINSGRFKQTAVTAFAPVFSEDIPLSAKRKDRIQTLLIQEQGLAELSLEKLCEECDAFLLLALDPYKRLSFFSELSKWGKPVFIDKPLSITLAESKEIADISIKTGTPFMSASALRFESGFQRWANTMEHPPLSLTVKGPLLFEKTFPGYFWYGIHLTEMIMAVMGGMPDDVHAELKLGVEIISMHFQNGTKAVLQGDLAGEQPFSAEATLRDGSSIIWKNLEPGTLFEGIANASVHFFMTGKSSVTQQEMLQSIELVERINHMRKALNK
ncbi:hypothetical protein AB1K32_06670 [Metabacillus dongyingensis]|uniref:hypothetical protein n=1 Tax=Metabacillus dongyingensis TaxID=2874282 RepID=UPI003B8C6224